MVKKLLMIGSLLLFFAAQAAAAGIVVKSQAQVEITVTNAQGEKEVKRVDASQANIVPGDTVIFSTHYVNEGSQPATNVVINNPMPEHMLYVDGSAEGKGTRIEFSVDHGATFASPEKLTVKEADGTERPATTEDYTNIRWIVEGALAKGQQGTVSFRAKVK